jgi:hypothetical protein
MDPRLLTPVEGDASRWELCGDPQRSWAAYGGVMRTYRYALGRTWDASKPQTLWMLLNPSTADHDTDDRTTRRLAGYAEAWGCGGYVLVNLFALRTTDPKRLRWARDPVGPGNEDVVLRAATVAGSAPVCGGGNGGALRGRGRAVADLLTANGVRLTALAVNSAGCPTHPLYLRRDLKPSPWQR